MKVQLINYTSDALNLLLFTKNTRLSQRPVEPADWDTEEKMRELQYMLGTIRSSWEFVDYTFNITGVTRAFTHQLVRTRFGASYAQQSQRTVDMTGFEYLYKDDEDYRRVMSFLRTNYAIMVQKGVPPQDARGILPSNILTGIVAKFNLRTLSDMARVRLCTRTQGEYQKVFRQLRSAVIEVHPWAEPFLRVACAADGVCQFPNYTECPIKPGIFNPDTGFRWDEAVVDWNDEMQVAVPPLTREEIQRLWERTDFEAVPHRKVKDD